MIVIEEEDEEEDERIDLGGNKLDQSSAKDPEAQQKVCPEGFSSEPKTYLEFSSFEIYKYIKADLDCQDFDLGLLASALSPLTTISATELNIKCCQVNIMRGQEKQQEQ